MYLHCSVYNTPDCLNFSFSLANCLSIDNTARNQNTNQDTNQERVML